MISLVKRFVNAFLWDESAFERYMRAGILLLGQLLHSGAIPVLNGEKAWWLGMIVSAAAIVIPAGDKTPEIIKEVAKRDIA